MLSEKDKTELRFWRTIDRLAKIQDISVSRLAINSGLHSTTLNKNKRISKNGKVRSISLKSLLAILESSKISFNVFFFLAKEEE